MNVTAGGRMRSTVLTLCLLLSTAAVSAAQARPKDEAGIRNRVAQYAAAVNKRDTEAIGGIFAPDADLVVFDGPRIVSRDSIRKAHEMITSWPSTKRFSLEVTNIRFLGSDLALVETVAHFSEGEMTSNRGTILARRRNGKWFWTALRVYPAERAS
jgi:uncharacterized protein (TIGR02246 family)